MENKDCVCKSSHCQRHGNCNACKAYHHARNEKTRCEQAGQHQKKA